MTRQELKIPFSWKERKPILLNRLLYIPEYFFAHDLYAHLFEESLQFFEKKQKIFVEYCSGNGEWIIEKAKQHPNINWIAVEKRFDRARKIWKKMHKENSKNLLVVLGEGLTFTKFYLPATSVHEVYINFPDPWPKNCHSKHRLLQKEFMQEITRIIPDNAKIIIATDDEITMQRTCDMFLSSEKWQSTFAYPYYVQNWQDYGYSYFSSLWQSKGKEIFYMSFYKKNRGRGI